MTIPGQSQTINENGTGSVEPATNIPLHAGYSSLGTANVMKSYNSISLLKAEQGEGEAVEAAAFDLANTGGPVRFMKIATSVASALSAVTASGGGPTVSVAGTPSDNYQAQIKIPTGGGGALGVGKFQYTLDNGQTWSETLTIPSGGTYAIPSTGITATFAAGTYVALETYTFTATAPMWNSTDLSNLFAALTTDQTAWDYIVLSGRQATGSAAATLAAALQTQLTTFANAFRYKRGMMDGGDEGTTAVLTAFASTVANRVLVTYRSCVLPTAKGFPGWGAPKMRLLTAVAQKAHAALISTDLARVKSGPIPGCISIEHNEQLAEVMDAAKITTARTIPNLVGFFITNGNLKSAAGSDFKYWQHGRIMDVACAAIYAKQAFWYSAGIRTNPDGTIFEADAAAIEIDVRTTLDALLTQPKNAEGKQGHVSAYRYTINRQTNFQQTGILLSDFACQALGYIKFFQTTLGYVSSFPAPVEAQAA